MCRLALKNGYRHFDTADMYGNEEEVGQAIRESGIPRSEIFLTTKLNNDAHDSVSEAFQASLQSLNCGYIDLYLMHWPQADGPRGVLREGQRPTFIDTWKDMEKLLDTGKVKSIGVSNFSIKTLSALLPHCTTIPAINQVELNPCLPQEELKAFCEEQGIVLTAYCPLGQSNRIFLKDADIVKIAESHTVTPAQVALSWGVQRGTIVIPKSENEGRMKQNITLIALSPAEMDQINAIHRKPNMHRSLCGYHSKGNGPKGGWGIFGWSYEELGWNMGEDGVVLDA
ncbi:hypothetical protein JAAARDRAFT_37592 [Jaapia argillacea MUCL 33604]|uniref:NADP-dependent oxidoreductase domain-containing protein n=1 Tax=Jaapia argillacea MUCL 33604 TaxID=933084 RepID=A0A067PUW5_9AGAM|nr:hypothetical protein JAAARDRAFT_37592 [Jaapia argillacea MUCL 33604]